MIKKLSHIVFAVLLLISTMGMAVSKHYCHGQLVSVKVFEEADSCCDDGGCCQNEDHFYQVKDDYSVPVISTVPVLAEVDILHQTLLYPDLRTPDDVSEEFNLTNDPPPATVPEFLAWGQVYLL